VSPNGKEEAMPLPKKKPMRLFTEYYGVLFLAIIALFILAGFLLFQPLILDFKTMNADASAAVVTLKDERDYLDSLTKSIAAAKTIPPETIAQVNEAMPRTVDIPKLLETMAVISESSKVKLTNISFAAPKGTESTPAEAHTISASPIDINLTLSAKDYATTRNFLKKLERNLRIMDVQSINVSGEESTG
jgi:hypothetical protein